MEHPPLEKIRAEHFALGQRVRRLEAEFQQRQREASGAAWADNLLELLDEFDRELREHFAFEERGGYFSEILAAAPRLAPRVARLKEHHVEFGEYCGRLLDAARNAASESDWDDVQTRAEALLMALREHEAEENELVSKAFADDQPAPAESAPPGGSLGGRPTRRSPG
jgi:hypothetical protein